MNPIKASIEYVRTSIAELKKVTWPTKDMTLRYTGMVIVASIVLAAFFAALDFGFSKGVTLALSQKKAPAAPQTEQTPVTPDLQPINVETATPDQNGNLQLDLTPSSTAQ